jgi:hypothetical protein
MGHGFARINTVSFTGRIFILQIVVQQMKTSLAGGKLFTSSLVDCAVAETFFYSISGQSATKSVELPQETKNVLEKIGMSHVFSSQ